MNKPFEEAKTIAITKDTLTDDIVLNGCVICGNNNFKNLDESILKCTNCGINYLITPDILVAALTCQKESILGVYKQSTSKYNTTVKKIAKIKTRTLKPNSNHSIK